MTDFQSLVRQLFHELAELPPAEQRRRLADAGAPTGVRDEVATLLEWSRRASRQGPLAEDHLGAANTRLLDAARSADVTAGQHIGRYRLDALLGSGGMGTVYLAEQQEPVRRPVALKVVKRGMDSAEVLARFELERRALAAMSHSGIAKVFDAGQTAQGQPYFVMELVLGLPLTEYCDRHRLPLAARIELFCQVCGAVQHAHQKGVIHRDLKPGNILVVQEGEQAAPKVLDFGLAKATDQQLVPDAALDSLREGGLGTPEYMAPEQAVAAPLDTRADIYSLGVILYELLTGQLPFASDELRRGDWLETRRLLVEVTPPRPSARCAARARPLPDVAERRRTTWSALGRTLRGDLDWIVLKALSKEPERRYDSATGLAMDLRRYLEHEPVLAGPPSARYRMKKFVRRHRLQVGAFAAVLVAIVGGGIGTGVGFAAARRRADENADLAAAEQDARRQAQEHLDDFRLLADVVQLADAREEAAALWPAVPDRAAAMRSWLDRYGRPLRDRLPVLEAALEDLRQQAAPRSPAEVEQWRAAHPLPPELLRARAQLACRQRAAEVRAGARTLAAAPLDAAAQALSAAELNAMAWPLVDPDGDRFGAEERGLAAARLALQKVDDGDASVERWVVLDTLAWACHKCGLDAAAMQHSEAAGEQCPPAARQEYADYTEKLRWAILQWRGPFGARRLAELRERAARLEAGADRAPDFADGSDLFLFRTLQDLVIELRAFAGPGGEVAGVAARLEAAETVQARSIDAFRPQWDRAIEAVAESAKYDGLRLRPQLGLAPLGEDPDTGLQEFVHLASGTPDAAVPARDPETGRLQLSGHMGIVFVLLPGGTFRMGATRDPADPDRDPLAQNGETAHEVTVSPFLLGKYELTRAQWTRMTGAAAFWWRAGIGYEQDTIPIGPLHPADSMDWDAADLWLSRYGLCLPTEAQWEYGCRAGTRTPWWPGRRAEDLQGCANLHDRRSVARLPQWGQPTPIDDGFTAIARVGTFRANAFGLHDVHGNVAEWCRDGFSVYGPEAAAGDRPRADSSVEGRIIRGGSHVSAAPTARSASRQRNPAATGHQDLGLRAARTLQR